MRFRELVLWMIESDGRHGAKKRVSDRLGIHPSDVSKILAGRRRVGRDVAMRVAKTIGMDPSYYDGTGSPYGYIKVPIDFELGGTAQPGRSLRDLRTRAEAVLDEMWSLGPAAFGKFPEEVRRTAVLLAREVLSAAILDRAREVLAADPKDDPLRHDRAAFELGTDLVTQIPEVSEQRGELLALAARLGSADVPDGRAIADELRRIANEL